MTRLHRPTTIPYLLGSEAKPGLLLVLDETGEVVVGSDHEVDGNTFMTWQGNWTGDCYVKGDVVFDTGWAMVANADTCDRPAPQPEDDPRWILEDLPTWATGIEAGYVLTGYRIEVPADEAWRILNTRIWTADQTDSSTYRVGAWNLDTGAYEFSIPLRGDSTIDGWLELQISTGFLTPGSWVIGLISQLGGTPTTFSHPWTYMGNLDNPIPNPGEVWRRQALNWRFNKFDLGGVDRSSVFEALVPGARFRVSLQEDPDNWRQSIVNGPATFYPDDNEYVIDEFSTDGGGPNGNLSGDANGKPADVLFDLPGLGPTNYLSLANGVASLSKVQGFRNAGFLFTNPVDGNEVVDETAYGLDLEFQQYTASDDWDLLAFTDLGGGSEVRGLTQVSTDAGQMPSGAIEIHSFPYRWRLNDSTPPPGRLSADDTTPSAITELYLHRVSDSKDISLFVAHIVRGHRVVLHDANDVGNNYQFMLVSEPVHVGDVWTIPVVFVDSFGPEFSTNEKIELFWRAEF